MSAHRRLSRLACTLGRGRNYAFIDPQVNIEREMRSMLLNRSERKNDDRVRSINSIEILRLQRAPIS